MNKTLPASKQLNSVILKLFLYIITGIFLTPTCLFADEVITTYDKKAIRYPSMFVGQIWAKSGQIPPPAREGLISTRTQEKSSSNLKANLDNTGMKVEKKLKQKRLKAIQAQAKGNPQKTALNQSSLLQASDKENQKTSEGKIKQSRKTASSKVKGFVTLKTGYSGRNWHHKQELYDVECGQKLARVVVTYYFDGEETLLGSNLSPDAQWHHIYPGSLEEKLYVELCHPSL